MKEIKECGSCVWYIFRIIGPRNVVTNQPTKKAIKKTRECTFLRLRPRAIHRFERNLQLADMWEIKEIVQTKMEKDSQCWKEERERKNCVEEVYEAKERIKR